MSTDEVQTMIEELIETHLSDEFRKPALEWVQTRAIAYDSILQLGLIKPGEIKT